MLSKWGKSLGIIIIIALVTVSTVLMIKPSVAQTIPEPSLPEFTVKFVNSSYTLTTTNAYTGLDETEQISNDSIELTITNQHFDYLNYQIYYNVRSRPHFEGNWTEIYPLMNYSASYNGGQDFSYAQYLCHSHNQVIPLFLSLLSQLSFT